MKYDMSEVLQNLRELKQWMEENNTNRLPSRKTKIYEERKLIYFFNISKTDIIKGYLAQSQEQQDFFKEKHPEIEELIEIVNDITHLLNEKEIVKSLKDSDTRKIPLVASKKYKEKNLEIEQIREGLIKTIEMVEREEEAEIDKAKVDGLNINNNQLPIHLKNAREIKQWMKEKNTTKPPSIESKNDKERSLASKLSNIRYKLIKPYKILESEKEKEEYRKRHPEIDEVMEIVDEIDRNNINISVHLKNVREIKQWMKEKNTTKPPSIESKNDKERSLANKLFNIRRRLIKPYKILESEKEKEEYRKRHPEIDEVMEIVDEINKSARLKNVREIKQCMKEKNTRKIPQQNSESAEERNLYAKWYRIKNKLINQYKILESEEEKEKFREEHPEIDEALEIVGEIDRNNINKSVYLKNVQEIKRWMKENNTRKTPSQNSESAEERNLYAKWYRIKNKLIKPYKMLESEKEKEKFREKHPEIDEVMEIVEEIYIISGKVKQKQVEELAYKDLALSEKLEQAKELERKYKDMLDKNIDENTLEESIGEEDE